MQHHAPTQPQPKGNADLRQYISAKASQAHGGDSPQHIRRTEINNQRGDDRYARKRKYRGQNFYVALQFFTSFSLA
jgi:hypothetical protein